VAVPALVVRILEGTGRVNLGQGTVMTVQGAGAALSPLVGGWVAQLCGYAVAFFVLGAFAVISILLWIAFAAAGSLYTQSNQLPKPFPRALLGSFA